MSTFDLEENLRLMDAAEPITDEQRRNATRVLDGVLAAAPDVPPPAGSLRRTRRRTLLAAAVAAVVAAVGGALFVLPGGIGGGAAYGSWTSVPSPLSADEITRIGADCLKEISATGRFDRNRAEVALAERRGEYAILLFHSTKPDMSGSCLAHNIPGSADVDDIKWGAGSGFSSSPSAPARGFVDGSLSDFRGASVTEGLAGAEVVGVTVHAGKLTAQATVTGGRYVVWWPGPAFEMRDGQPVDFLRYDLTLRDGTVLHDVKPTHG
ncbi:hypothetical protein [Actinoplanes cyaneus]|nr:hypothetical protein [Actinoplanes cyaneus]MCW2142231.1 hypothetical protein [Actinoplanes cyaneus]